MKQIEATLAAGGHTAPTRLGIERRTNPFLRPDDPAIRKHLGMEKAEDWEVFGEICARNWLTIRASRLERQQAANAESANAQVAQCQIAEPVRM